MLSFGQIERIDWDMVLNIKKLEIKLEGKTIILV